MQIAYCNGCGGQIKQDGAARSSDGRLFCAKCAAALNQPAPDAFPQFERSANTIGNETTGELVALSDELAAAQPANSVTKFYFCETCGKRITDQQLAQGQGRDKKLKGVYCSACAVGVQTIEFEPIRIAPTPAAPPVSDPTPAPAPIPIQTPRKPASATFKHRGPTAPATPPRPTSRVHNRPNERALAEAPERCAAAPKRPIAVWIGAGAGVLILAVALVVGLKGDKPNASAPPTQQSAAVEHPTAQPAVPSPPPPSPPSPPSPPPPSTNTAPAAVPAAPAAEPSAAVKNASGRGTGATYITTDVTTQGNWKSAYGADGYGILGDATSYPSYAAVAVRNASTWTEIGSTDDPRALERAKPGGGRVAAWWYNNLTIKIDLADGQTHRLAIYCMDWKADTQAQAFEIRDPHSGALLDGPRKVTKFHNGAYVVWDIKGHVVVKLNTLGGEVAGICGIFLGGAKGKN